MTFWGNIWGLSLFLFLCRPTCLTFLSKTLRIAFRCDYEYIKKLLGFFDILKIIFHEQEHVLRGTKLDFPLHHQLLCLHSQTVQSFF